MVYLFLCSCIFIEILLETLLYTAANRTQSHTIMYIDLALWLRVINTSGRFCTPLGHILEFDVIDVSGVMDERGGVCGGVAALQSLGQEERKRRKVLCEHE